MSQWKIVSINKCTESITVEKKGFIWTRRKTFIRIGYNWYEKTTGNRASFLESKLGILYAIALKIDKKEDSINLGIKNKNERERIHEKL